MFDMTGNVFRNLFSKPATRMYPAIKREPFENARGSLDIEFDKCIICGMCARKCPSDAIKTDRNEKSWELNPFKCIACAACVEACPKKCLFMHAEYKPAAASKSLIKHVQEPKPVEADQTATGAGA